MCNSLIVGAIKMGLSISIATPKNYKVDSTIVKWASENGIIEITDDVNKAVENSDIVYTDVFSSMGMENEKEQRLKDFSNFCVNSKLMKKAKKDAIVLHCLPAHREEEISEEILELHSKEIFEQADRKSVV